MPQDSTIRVGLIGFGFVSKTFHVPLLQGIDGYKITAVSSSRPADVSAMIAGVDVVSDPKALADMPDFPEIYREEAREGREALAIWRNEAKGLEWTYLSPAAEIASGNRTGKYRTTGDKLLVDDKGKSFITFEDYAVAVLDELERPQHVAKRFGVAY